MRISGEHAAIYQGGLKAGEITVPELVDRIRAGTRRAPSCTVLPPRTRAWIEQGDYVATCIEVDAHVRTVYWIAEDSPMPFGEDARYERRRLAFPYVEILLLFDCGSLTGTAQLYYRRSRLDTEGALDFCNLLNVSPDSYGVPAWLCLLEMDDVSRKPWDRKIEAVIEHVFCAGFNRSSDESEGGSFWAEMRELDPRVATVEAWERATRENPLFVLDVPWKSSGTTVTAELERMLASAVSNEPVRTAADLWGAVMSSRGRARRRRCFPFI
jgi:hypothetical protein